MFSFFLILSSSVIQEQLNNPSLYQFETSYNELQHSGQSFTFSKCPSPALTTSLKFSKNPSLFLRDFSGNSSQDLR